MTTPEIESLEKVVWPVLAKMADCLCQQITDSGLPEPCFCGIYPGDQAPFDYCDGCEGGKCGQAWVRLVTLFPSTQFPVQEVMGRCTSPLAMQLEVGILRCAPVGGDDGTPPSLADQLETSALQVSDAMVIRRAIVCCASTAKREHQLLGYVPVGPLGGCVGGAWTVTFSEF